MRRPAIALLRDEAGATIVEFALIAPALLMVLLGFMDLSYNIYTTTLLEGAIQQAGRESTIEGAELKGAAIDSRLRSVVDDIVPNADIAISRRAYIDFSDIGKPEEFVDTNDDGTCNNGEAFEDINGNGTWDEDRGRGDMGGARDAVLYDVTVTYPRAFPVMGLLGFSHTVSAEAQTVLRNQPYGPQNRPAGVGNCT